MADQPVVAASAANPAPAAPAPANPAPAAPAAPQADVADENVVNLADIMGNQKAEKEGSGTPTPDGKPANPAPEPPKTEAAPYKSQKEVDAAFGKRIEAERRKWERSHPANKALEILRDMNPGLTDEQLLTKLEGDRDEALENPSALLAAIKQRGILGGKPPAQSGEPEPSEPDAQVELSDEEASSVSAEIGKQAMELEKLDPEFKVDKFLEGLGLANLVAVGRGQVSLWEFYLRSEGSAGIARIREAGVKAGKEETTRNILERNGQVPAPVSPSAPASVARDFTNMSKAEWDENQKAIKAAHARGEKVRL